MSEVKVTVASGVGASTITYCVSLVAQVNMPKVKVMVATSSELQCYLHLCGESYSI